MTAIPQAAGIIHTLTAAGLPADQVHAWFAQPRRELAGLTPGVMLALARAFPGAAQRVLDLADCDARDFAATLPAGWEGSE